MEHRYDLAPSRKWCLGMTIRSSIWGIKIRYPYSRGRSDLEDRGSQPPKSLRMVAGAKEKCYLEGCDRGLRYEVLQSRLKIGVYALKIRQHFHSHGRQE